MGSWGFVDMDVLVPVVGPRHSFSIESNYVHMTNELFDSCLLCLL